MKPGWKRGLGLLLGLAMAAFPASAQTRASLSAVTDQPGAALSGVVTDKTGAALAYVTVTIKNLDKAETRTIETDGGGRYQEFGLPAGRFEIRAAKRGFSDETRAKITLA